MKQQTLKSRYAAKLTANLVGLAIGMVTQAIIPRGLGPKAYGDFSFLSNFFSQIMPFFSLSTSNCFYTKISQRQYDFRLISFYAQFTGLVAVAIFFFVALSQATGLYDIFWVDQRVVYVYLGAIWGILTWVSSLVTHIADAYGLTVSTEIARICQKAFGLLIVVALFLLNQMNLVNFFLYHFCILLVLIVSFIWVLHHNREFLSQGWSVTRDQIKGYAREFYDYSHPLFIYALIGMVVGILDRWMLQKFSGSVQQGFFGLSHQIGAICFLFTSAMSALITREFSIAYANHDLKEMARLFRRYIPLLYSIAAFFGCFACVQADKITYIFGGAKFAGAVLPVAIMALYPIHQTYGQLSGSVFYATGQTALYRNVGVFFMLLGLPMAYLMVAPSDQMGLDAGATGLAIKFVILQFIGVNVQLWFNARFLNLKFWRYFAHQVICVACLISTAILVKYVIDGFAAFENTVIWSILVSGVVYSLAVVTLGYFLPRIFGLKRQDIRGLARKAGAYIGKR